jgi:hypothetical protein
VCTSAEKFCANCKGPHPANSLECPFIAKATAVEKLCANGRSYAQAVKEVELSVQRQAPSLVVPSSHASYASIVEDSSPPCSSSVALTTVAITADVHQSQGSCSGVHTKQSQPLVSQQAQSGSTVVAEEGQGGVSTFADLRGIMKEELASIKKRLDDIIRASLTGFSIRLGQFLNEVFKLNLMSEGTKERSLLLISLLRNAFGPEVSEALQEEWLPANGVVSGQDQTPRKKPSEDGVTTIVQTKKVAGTERTRSLLPLVGSASLQLNRVLPKQGGRSKGRGKGKTASGRELSQ